jgi:3-isopropylmalate/(R)-2-methylmalate dehydratase large subunit
MGYTAVEKIFMSHSVKPLKTISPGDIVICNAEYGGSHEGWIADVYRRFEDFGDIKGVFDPEKFAFYMGHHMGTTTSDLMAANYQKTREYAAKIGVKVYDLGTGICHILIVEQGIAHPGTLTVFGDSHTLGCGVTGGIGVQCGGEMMEYILTGTMWFKIPPTQKYIIEGTAPTGVYPRDVIQYIIGEVGMDNSVYKAIEWDGSYIHSQPIPLRFPFTMMSVELGAKTAFIEPDEITLEYIKDRVKGPYEIVKTDPDAKIESEFRFDVSNLTPQVAAPSNPGNTKPIADELGNRIDQVCIGTCCGSSVYDMRTAAEIMKGHRVKARTIIVPGTREVLSQCAAEGLLQVFVDAGADILPAHCGTCQTISCAHLAPGETQMHPGPRNWTGRTAEGSFTYLASPATCAASAIEGKVADCRKYL